MDYYVIIAAPGHPNADSKGNIPEHRLIAAKALGRALPYRVEVHHVDGTRSNNKNGNLVICEDGTYHKLLHARAKALKEHGDVHAIDRTYAPVMFMVGKDQSARLKELAAQQRTSMSALVREAIDRLLAEAK